MKAYTRKKFAARGDDLRKMRKKDPIQFELLFIEYCRIMGFNHYASKCY